MTKRNEPRRIKLTELRADPANLNAHSERGMGMLENSLRRLGAGRSILADKNGVILAGNATHEELLSAGFTDAIVVPTHGDVAVVVQRLDLDAAEDRGREMAMADNRVGEVNLTWAPEPLAALVEASPELVGRYWTAEELAPILRPNEDEGAGGGAEPNPCNVTLKFESEDVALRFAQIVDGLKAAWLLGSTEAVVMRALRNAAEGETPGDEN